MCFGTHTLSSTFSQHFDGVLLRLSILLVDRGISLCRRACRSAARSVSLVLKDSITYLSICPFVSLSLSMYRYIGISVCLASGTGPSICQADCMQWCTLCTITPGCTSLSEHVHLESVSKTHGFTLTCRAHVSSFL